MLPEAVYCSYVTAQVISKWGVSTFEPSYQSTRIAAPSAVDLWGQRSQAHHLLLPPHAVFAQTVSAFTKSPCIVTAMHCYPLHQQACDNKAFSVHMECYKLAQHDENRASPSMCRSVVQTACLGPSWFIITVTICLEQYNIWHTLT